MSNAPTSLRGKTVVAHLRNHAADRPIVLSECMFEERGGRLFLVGTSQPAQWGAKEWTNGVRRALAWEAVEQYLLFESADEYYARVPSVMQDEPQMPQIPFVPGFGPMFEAPQSSEGVPVEPSGVHMQPETPLDIGDTVLSYSQGRWWRAEVIGFEGDDSVQIHFPGWDSKWDVSVPKTELQVDLRDSLENR